MTEKDEEPEQESEYQTEDNLSESARLVLQNMSDERREMLDKSRKEAERLKQKQKTEEGGVGVYRVGDGPIPKEQRKQVEEAVELVQEISKADSDGEVGRILREKQIDKETDEIRKSFWQRIVGWFR